MNRPKPILQVRLSRFTMKDLACRARQPHGVAENGSATVTPFATKRRRGVVLGAALVFLLAVPARSEGQDRSLVPVTLRVGFTKARVLGLNQNDAEAAFKVFAETVGKKRGYLIRAQTFIFDTLPELESAIAKESIILIMLDTWDYLSLHTPEMVEPQFAPMEQGILFKQYLLLTRRGSELNKLADLRGKNVEILANANVSLAKPWFDTLLLDNHLGPKEVFLGSVEVVEKAFAAVLPVFFGRKHVCVVDQPAFDLMKELNPQVGHMLQVIAASKPYFDGMIAFNRSGWPSAKHKEDLYRGLAELHLEPGGQQILTLFRTDRLLPFQGSYLDNVRELRSSYERLREEDR